MAAALALAGLGLPAFAASLSGTFYPGLGYDIVTTPEGGETPVGYMKPSMSYTLPSSSSGGTASGKGVGLGAAQLSTGSAMLGYRGMVIAPTGTYTLGTLGVNSVDGWTPLGSGSSSGQAVDGKGGVAGTSTLYSQDGTQNLGGRAVYYAPGDSTPQMLAVPKNYTDVTGTGYMGVSNMSTSSVIVGYGTEVLADGSTSGSRVLRWSKPTAKPAVLDHVAQGNAVGTASWGVDVNKAGDVVGKGNLISAKGKYMGMLPALWPAGATQATVLQSLSKPLRAEYRSGALSISDSGVVVGSSAKYADDSSDLGDRAVRWAAGSTTPEELGGLGTGSTGQAWSYAISVNAKGVASGVAQKYSDAGTELGQRAVRWAADGSAAEELGLLSQGDDGSSFSYAFGMNDKGYVVGQANVLGTKSGDMSNPYTVAVHAVVWKPNGKAVDLNKLLPKDSGWTLVEAVSISKSGWITGIGFYQPPGYSMDYAYQRMFAMQLVEKE